MNPPILKTDPALRCSQCVSEQIKKCNVRLDVLGILQEHIQVHPTSVANFKSFHGPLWRRGRVEAAAGGVGRGWGVFTIDCCQHEAISVCMAKLHSAALLFK